jgi:hypothetical protein
MSILLVMALPSPANAADWVSISGSTFSSSSAWHVSENIRTKSGDSAVKAKFSSRPLLADGTSSDQLKFGIVHACCYPSYPIIGSIQYFSNSSERTLVSTLASGTQFRTTFARYTTCNNCNHNFAGQLYY